MDGVELLADKNTKAWEFALRIQKYIKETKDSDVPLKEVSIKHFNNGEIDMHVPENMRRKEIYFIHDSTKSPQEWWIELLLLKDLLLNASAESITFVLPDLLYSRKDRKEKPHVPISARALSSSISANLKRIITMDLHADQIQSLYPANCPMDALKSFPEVVKYIERNPLCALNNLVIVSPDAGGVNRAKSFAQKLGVKNPIAFIYKRRDKPGEIAEMRLVGEVRDLNVLIIDDIIDSGGTLCEAANLLKQNGAKEVYCYGTHGIFSKGTSLLSQCFSRIMTSNTHCQENSSIEVIDMSSVFAEAIYRAQKGLSISKLFE
jgi:ribose-phosphate pyrophosphokinase